MNCFDQFDDPDQKKVEGHNVDEEQVAGARLGTSAGSRSSTGCTWHMWSCYGWRYHIYNWTWLYIHLSGSLKMMWSVKSAKTRSNTSEGCTYNNKSAPLKTNLYQWHLLIIFIFSSHLWPCKRNWRACSLHFRQGCIGSLAQRSTRLSWCENIITLMIVCWCDDGDLYN